MQAISFGQMPSEYRVKPVRREDYKEAKQNRENLMRQFDNNENLRRAYIQAVRTANLTDKELLSIAKYDAHKDDKYKMNTYTAALIAVPTIDTFLSGVTTDAPKLSGKLSTMGKAAVGWGGVFALAGLYNGAVNKITAISPTMQKFEEQHPVLKSLLGLAGFAALLIGGQKGINKLAEVLPKKLPGLTKDLAKVSDKVANYINETNLNVKILKPLKDKVVAWAVKNPKTASTGASALALSVPFMALGALFKAFTDKAEKSEQIKDTYNKLAEARQQNRDAVAMVNMRMQTAPLAMVANKYATNYGNEIESGEILEAEEVEDIEAEHLNIEA